MNDKVAEQAGELGVATLRLFTEGNSAAEPQPKVVGVRTPWVW